LLDVETLRSIFEEKISTPKNVFQSVMNYSSVREYTVKLMLICCLHYYQYSSSQRSYFTMQKISIFWRSIRSMQD